MKLYQCFIIIIQLLVIMSCVRAPEYPIEPVIQWIGMSKDSIRQSSIVSSDSIRLSFSFTDGDGDIGDDDSLNVFLIDERTGGIGQQYKIPFLAQHAGAKGISGEVSLTIRQTCCIYYNGQLPCTPGVQQKVDTLVYRINIKDRAGHFSNTINTPLIKVLCQ